MIHKKADVPFLVHLFCCHKRNTRGNDIEISIYSRKEIEELFESDFPKRTVVISFYAPLGIAVIMNNLLIIRAILKHSICFVTRTIRSTR